MGPKRKFDPGNLVLPVAKKYGVTPGEVIEVVDQGAFDSYVVDFGHGSKAFLASQVPNEAKDEEEKKMDEDNDEDADAAAAAPAAGGAGAPTVPAVVARHGQHLEVLDELDAEMAGIPPAE
jgi:hypothetical protein